MYTQILTSKFGAELISFKLNGKEKIHQGEEVLNENGKPYWNRRYSILFPMVGKCKKNQTIINSKTYETTLNGFAKDSEFEPITKLDNFHSYMLKSNEKSFEKYPYKFTLYVTYRLDGNKLTTIYKVLNEGNTDMPFGIGSDPAFKIDSNELKLGNYYLEFEEKEDKLHFLYLVDGLVGTDYAKNIKVDNKKIFLNSDMFKDGSVIIKGINTKKVYLKDKYGRKKLAIEFDNFQYLSIWSKPNAPFICISPWVTTPDSVNATGVFRQKSDIVLLPPKEMYECKYTVEFFEDL